jgi:hypothetical protein
LLGVAESESVAKPEISASLRFPTLARYLIAKQKHRHAEQRCARQNEKHALRNIIHV